MRFIPIVFLVLVLCFALTAAVFADGSSGFVGPDEVYPREVFELEFRLDQPGVTKITGQITVDTENLQLKSIYACDESRWHSTSDMNGHIFQRLAEGAGQEPVFRIKVQLRSVEEGTKIWIRMHNVVFWYGDSAVQMGDILWEKTVGHIASGDNLLTELRLSDCALSPEFSPYQQNYTAVVSHEVGQVQVTAVTSNEGATVQISSPQLEQGMATDVTVTVTAEDGSIRVYTISVTRENAPDRIPSNNCDLESLSVTDFKLSPEFRADVTQYVLWLPYETTGVEVDAVAADIRATVTIAGNRGFKAGQDNPIYVICTAEDGTQKQYIIIAKRAQAHEQQTEPIPAGDIYTDGNEVPVWVYIVVAVIAAAGCTAVVILIADRKK